MTRVRFGLAVLALFSAVSPIQADFLTGNPSVDSGWTGGNNSLANGTYIRGGANYSFDAYRSAYTVQTGDALATSGWAVGSTVVGMGGVIRDTQPGGWSPQVTGATLNNPTGAGLTNLRIVSKFGTDPSVPPTTGFTASTVAPGTNPTPNPTGVTGPGNGRGDFSGGQGGVGTVLVRTRVDASVLAANGAAAGTLITPTSTHFLAQRYNGSGVDDLSAMLASIARFYYLTDGDGNISSWEMLLNVSNLTGPLPRPTTFSAFNQAGQAGSGGGFTDALLPGAPIPVTPTPVPPSLAISLLGVFTLAGLRFRRR